MAHYTTWWYQPPGFTNFGDELGPTFLQLLGHEIERVPFAEAEILTTGSILQRHTTEPLRAGTIIWGTGWHKQPIQNLPKLDIRAVRGTVTATQLNTTDVPLGDPGLLASYFWPAAPKHGKVGFVRHYIDTRTFPDAQTIDTRMSPEEVCREISACSAIISSSLHGCIVAASYGIPFLRLPHPKVVGGDTKWIDFATSLTRPLHQIQHDLLEAIA